MSADLYDVAVLGGGNAALCAALAAAGRGARVIVVERAPRDFRGGNSRHTRNLRCMHAAPTDVLTDAYTEDEFMADVLRVTGGVTNEALARLMIRGSADATRRMGRFGARFQPPLRGTLHLGRTNAFFLGGGKALMNSAYAAAGRLGVRVAYDAEVIGLSIRDGRFESATVRMPAGDVEVRARAVVLAAGGFEANLEWLAEIWGEAAKNFIIRGTPYNTGTVLRLMLDAGAEPVGDPAQCHAVAIDARAPKFDGGIVTRLDSVPLGIVVNRFGDRFYDEGEDYWPKRYAIWGRLVAQQPDQIAYSIVDSKALGRFMPSVFPPMVAGSVRELAAAINVPAGTLASTIERFNAAVRPGTFDHQALDDCRTEGLVPNKTHWAQRLDAPPFHAYPLRPGITFTYLGVKVDERARVVMKGGVAENIFAAGEIMAGNILGRGYVAGVGMTIGTVFGEIAGRESFRE
ncbi:MAG TPA: FAD-dependent tricarballylate dehydrogenase TcuA [Vicinamibacterales bacterium]|nr:FAD-dependent tricarballylate dehydrogenase TcuA [Vicinamibacterales bacterium]